MPDGVGSPLLLPAVVLSILVGAFQTSAFLVIFGRIGWQTPITLILAIVGAWVGDASLGPGTVLRLGDYSLLWASIGAWLAIGLIEGLMWLRGRRREAEVVTGAARIDAP